MPEFIEMMQVWRSHTEMDPEFRTVS